MFLKMNFQKYFISTNLRVTFLKYEKTPIDLQNYAWNHGTLIKVLYFKAIDKVKQDTF